VHDNPDDNSDLFQYDCTAAVRTIEWLEPAVRSESKGGTVGGATNRGRSENKKANSETTDAKPEGFKAGHWPCFIF